MQKRKKKGLEFFVFGLNSLAQYYGALECAFFAVKESLGGNFCLMARKRA
jgi:hypothetical protein